MVNASGAGAPSDPAVVGRIVRPHGLAGELVVEPADVRVATCEPGARIWIADGWRRVSRCRLDNKGRWVIALEGVADRDAAEALRGSDLIIEAGELPELAADSYYVHDLVGCQVEDEHGAALGEVVAVIRGPQDLLEIERGGRRSLVPMARDLLKEIDVRQRRIVIDVPAGLDEATRV